MSKNCPQRRSDAEKLQLITECRTSGLSDHEWCRQNGIASSTFYGWISKLRKEACTIPEPTYTHAMTQMPKQDVVRVDIQPDYPDTVMFPLKGERAGMHFDNSHTITMEIRISDITIHLTNDADPMLLTQMIRALKGGGLC